VENADSPVMNSECKRCYLYTSDIFIAVKTVYFYLFKQRDYIYATKQTPHWRSKPNTVSISFQMPLIA